MPSDYDLRGGTTSACAENTHLVNALFAHLGNYLRVRGEYRMLKLPKQKQRELPPRARRIPRVACGGGLCVGTTSACAENTTTGRSSPTKQRNYLRVRGEYHILRCVLNRDLGTTSACAENTNQGPGHGHRGWNYLRVRGEYI